MASKCLNERHLDFVIHWKHSAKFAIKISICYILFWKKTRNKTFRDIRNRNFCSCLNINNQLINFGTLPTWHPIYKFKWPILSCSEQHAKIMIKWNFKHFKTPLFRKEFNHIFINLSHVLSVTMLTVRSVISISLSSYKSAQLRVLATSVF